jgi:peptidoglycan/xylan/chitin deacetylase (PgdA/CDA1 family)
MISGDEPIQGQNLLLTFDDGFASNRVVAEEILNPMGIRALFFAVSDFVALEDREEARHFIAKNIQPGSSADKLPSHLINMRWTDLEALLEQGHCVGGHTRTHTRLSQINTESDLEREIISSADTLEKRLGVPIEHFAYTFGDIASFSEKALAIAKSRFRFIYSGLRGDNTFGVSPLALRRDAVNAHDSTALLGAFLEGLADLHYVQSRAELDSWL